MSYQKGEVLYSGKAKTIYSVQGSDDLIWMEFKNSLTAFNALKKGEFEGKGAINLRISEVIFDYLTKKGIATHSVEKISGTEWVCKKLTIIPLEVVVRNVIAGSLAKKFGRKEGEALSRPLVEFYFKDDELGDPFVSADQALLFGLAESEEVLTTLKQRALEINKHLQSLFESCQVLLVDFKLEFGMTEKGEVILADEISPDSCRLWDIQSGERMDKDRFRRDLGQVKESYEEILKRLTT